MKGVHLSGASTSLPQEQRECGVSEGRGHPEVGTWEEEQVGGTHGLGTFSEVELMGLLGPGWKGCAQDSARCP